MGGEAAGGDAAAGTGAVPSAAAHDRSQAAGLRDYWRVLAAHRHFRYLWCAEMVDNIVSGR